MPRKKATPQRFEYAPNAEQQAAGAAGTGGAVVEAIEAQPQQQQQQQQQQVSSQEYDALTAMVALQGENKGSSGPSSAAATTSRPAISSPLSRVSATQDRGTPGRRGKRDASQDEGPATKRGKSRTPRRGSKPSQRGSSSRAEDDASALQPYMVETARNLTKALKTRMFLCWSMYEFFYSSLDKVIFKDTSPFDEFLGSTFPNIATMQEFRRAEWFFIRRQFASKPRRFSQQYILQQRQWLYKHRMALKQLQYGAPTSIRDLSLPPDVPLVLSVGDRVLAKLLQYKGLLSTGMILAVLFKEDAYRIAFDRNELGIQTVPADDVAPLEPPRMISSARLVKQTAHGQAADDAQSSLDPNASQDHQHGNLLTRQYPPRDDRQRPESLDDIMDSFFAEVQDAKRSTYPPYILVYLAKIAQMKHELLEAAKTLPDDMLYAGGETSLQMNGAHLRWILDKLERLREAGRTLTVRLRDAMHLTSSGGMLQGVHTSTHPIHTERAPIALPQSRPPAVDEVRLQDVMCRAQENAQTLVEMQASTLVAAENKRLVAALMSVLFAIQMALKQNLPADDFRVLFDDIYQRLRDDRMPTALCNSVRFQVDAIRQQVFHGNELHLT